MRDLENTSRPRTPVPRPGFSWRAILLSSGGIATGSESDAFTDPPSVFRALAGARAPVSRVDQREPQSDAYAEPGAELRAPAVSAVAATSAEHPEGGAAVVTHGAFIDGLAAAPITSLNGLSLPALPVAIGLVWIDHASPSNPEDGNACAMW